MYLEHFNLNRPPFAEEPDPDMFFSGAGRGAVFKSLREELQAGKPLIRVTGSEGSGKTMLCRLLCRHLFDDDCEVVYIDNPVGSFDDLLHVVCLDLGMDPSALPDKDMFSELRRLLASRRDEQKKVILIVDEGEKLFLAALERLMRALCEVGEDHVLQVLLVGRPALNVNLDQLTVYCSDVDIKGGYVLEPLTEEETARYLKFRLMAAGLSPDSREEIFTDGAVHKIFESAGGNLRLINILAEEALQTSSTDKSFLVLLDHVAGQDDKPEKKAVSLRVPVSLPDKKVMLLAGGALAVLLLLIFLFSGGGDEKKIKPVSEAEPPVVAAPVTETPELEMVPEPVEQAAEEEVVILEEERPPVPVVQPVLPVEQVVPELQPDGIVELTPAEVKTLPATGDDAAPATVAPKKVSPAVSGPVAAATADSANRSGDQLYRERLRSSAKWLAGAYHNTYTVQLMMLASEQAAPNIKKMLVQDDYFAIKNNLYILRKKTSPPTLFVFYGTYDSMEQARQARNNMPLFLRKHHPYALSISDAMKKTED